MRPRRRASRQTLITPQVNFCCQPHLSFDCLSSSPAVCCRSMSCDLPLTSRDTLELNNWHFGTAWTSLGLVPISVVSFVNYEPTNILWNMCIRNTNVTSGIYLLYLYVQLFDIYFLGMNSFSSISLPRLIQEQNPQCKVYLP